ncbi:MAG: DHH family phosphoesterase, partial [Gammaproteobacteria bacterium]
LEAGASVFYADHHFAGDIPQHENLSAHIDPAADTCTSLIVNRYLEGAHARWAVVGAFGDNFDPLAAELGRSLGLDESGLDDLQQLGICLNYNGYGFELDDLMYHPAELFDMLHPFNDPFDFLREESYQSLLHRYRADIKKSADASPESADCVGAIYLLPNDAWARRIVGVMGNDLAKRHPERAHALLIDMGDGHYRVSVRAPYNAKRGADALCRQFPTGGGRQAVAAIVLLTYDTLAEFIEKFHHGFGASQ